MVRALLVSAGSLALTLTLATPASQAATITIVDKDAAGEGFNDPTPVAPIGGNPGTTRGQQRLNVFNQAAAVWGGIIPSAVTIKVDANFDPMFCNATSAVLGSAGATGVIRDFTGAEFASTWYPVALAERQAGANLNGTASEIQAQFNVTVDDNTCLGTANWYYGYDHNHGSNIDLLAVVLHELGHGLGFVSFVDLSSGQYAGYPSDPHTDVFTRCLYDDTQAKLWDQLSAAQRAASAVNTGKLVWAGAAGVTHASDVLVDRRVVDVEGPGITGNKESGTADFGPALTSTEITAQVVYVNDGVGTAGDGCETPFANAAQVSGKIALIDRGTCAFTTKTKDAQLNGAVAVVIANNTSGVVFMAGTDPTITIPTVSISPSDGTALKTALASGTVIVTLATAPPLLQGADDNNRPRMYAPNPLVVGSSVSHFDVAEDPDLLMEPVITPLLTSSVDLTRYVFEDLGWFLPRPAGVGGPGALALSLESGAPNPFRVRTAIRYSLSRAGLTQMDIFDVSGRAVKRLMNAWAPAGAGSVAWDATNDDGQRVASGVYLYRIRCNGESRTQRVVVTD